MTLRAWKGLSPAVLDEAGVSERDGLVRVPYRLPDGSVQLTRVFARSGRCWWEPSGRELIPFGVEMLPHSSLLARRTAVLVCEGESDTLAAREAFAFYADDIADAYVAIGLPGAGTWRRPWRAYLEPHPLVYLCPDGDEAGRRMARAVLADVPWARGVHLPEDEDVRNLLQRDGARALDPLLDAADAGAQLDAALKLARSLDEFETLLALAGLGR